MAVRVRLDDGHEIGRADVLAQPRDVVTDHAEIYLCFRRSVHDLTVCQQQGWRGGRCGLPRRLSLDIPPGFRK